MNDKRPAAVSVMMMKAWRKAANVPKEDIVLVLFFTLTILTVIWMMMDAL